MGILISINPDSHARFHVDTNGSLLTPDYIDELVEAGMTDIGIDLKGMEVDTFQRITGLKDRTVAESCMENAWAAVSYIQERYKNRVFLGIEIPYNKELIPLPELENMAKRIYAIDPGVQVCVLDYRPEFRKRDLVKPLYGNMVEIHRMLRSNGLETVLSQTERGHIGPEL